MLTCSGYPSAILLVSSVMVGETLSHYRILEQIGAGGMGVVYLAHDERLERDVALKVLPAGTLADETARKRFRREALTLSKLNHPNIADARVQAASGKADSAVAVLNRAVEEAARFDFVIYQFDARLALGEIEIKSGKISAWRNRLETLKKDAQAKQFLLIAGKAAKH